jgi:hypothetical protein
VSFERERFEEWERRRKCRTHTSEENSKGNWRSGSGMDSGATAKRDWSGLRLGNRNEKGNDVESDDYVFHADCWSNKLAELSIGEIRGRC